MGHKCEICGEGTLSSQNSVEPIEYKGRKGEVQLRFSVCGSCGSETATDDDLRENKRSFLRFRKDVDGLLSGEAIRATRKHYRITQGVAAKIFGGGPVAFSKYENDDVAHSESMDKLLRLASAMPPAFAWLCDYAGESTLAREVLAQSMESLRKMLTERAHRPFLDANRFERPTEEREGLFSSVVLSSTPANDENYACCGTLG